MSSVFAMMSRDSAIVGAMAGFFAIIKNSKINTEINVKKYTTELLRRICMYISISPTSFLT